MEDALITALLIGWAAYAIVLAWLCGFVAAEKGRDAFNWAVLGLLLGIVALIALAGLPNRRNGKCPFCREGLYKEATACPHCQHDLLAVVEIDVDKTNRKVDDAEVARRVAGTFIRRKENND